MKKLLCITLAAATLSSATPVMAEVAHTQGNEAKTGITLQQNTIKPNMNPDKIVWYFFEQSLYSLRYSVIKQIGIGLDILNREAEIYTECTTYENADISITAKLQQYKSGAWKTIATYENSTYGKSCSILEYKMVTQGYDYRVVTTSVVSNGSGSDDVTKTGTTVYCD